MANVERKQIDKSKLKDVKVIWVIGGPGSGKGTQCENIQAKYGYKHLSTGDLIRTEVMNGSNRGGQLYKLMSTGQRVPDEIVDDLLAEAMVSKVDNAKESLQGFLIDGFPMDAGQASAFCADICPPLAVLVLEATDEVLKDRLVRRANFDDTLASIEKRVANFNEVTLPLVEAYSSKVTKINAERSKEEIFEDIQKVMEKL